MSAVFSPCRTWRYTLTRLTENALARQIALEVVEERLVASEVRLPGLGRMRTDFPALVAKQELRDTPRPSTVAFIGLNPSTADETVNDPTVRKCVGFAGRWGYERMVMLNLFGFRSTDPRGLREPLDAVGPQNDYYLLKECEGADFIVCAWGAHGAMVPRLSRIPTTPRGEQVTSMLRSELGAKLHVLGLTKDGHPRHPLYLRGDTEPVPW